MFHSHHQILNSANKVVLLSLFRCCRIESQTTHKQADGQIDNLTSDRRIETGDAQQDRQTGKQTQTDSHSETLKQNKTTNREKTWFTV